MALELEQTLDTGVVANYWKIDRVDYDSVKETAKVGFGLYITATIVNNGGKAVKMTWMNFNEVSKESMDNNGIANLYALAKASILDDKGIETNMFVEATDV